MHLYRINTKNNQQFLDDMKQKNIQCGIHYKSTHNDGVYKNYAVNSDSEKLPKSDKISESTVSIPFHEKLSMAELETIIKEVNKNA